MIPQSVFREHAEVMNAAAMNLPAILERVATELYACFNRGNKVLACGNGGSASDADHFVGELVGRYKDERRALPAVAIAGGMAAITAIGNDYGYESVFARQVDAIGQPGDWLCAISTSGNSRNVLAAVEAAHKRGCHVVALTGQSGGQLAKSADITICAPSSVTARIQEVHILCIHIICELLDAKLRASGE